MSQPTESEIAFVSMCKSGTPKLMAELNKVPMEEAFFAFKGAMRMLAQSCGVQIAFVTYGRTREGRPETKVAVNDSTGFSVITMTLGSDQANSLP